MALNSKKGLRIAFLHPDLGIGGAERLVVDAAIALQNSGHDVCMYTSHHDKNHCFEETRNGTLKVKVIGDFLPTNIKGKGHIVFASLRNLLAASSMIWNWDEKPYDILFIDQLSISIPLFLLVSTKVYFYCHFPDMLLTSRDTFLKSLYRYVFDTIEERTTGLSNLISVNSQFTAKTFAKTFKYLAGKNVKPSVLYPSIDFKAYHTNEEYDALVSKFWKMKQNIPLAYSGAEYITDEQGKLISDAVFSSEENEKMKTVVKVPKVSKNSKDAGFVEFTELETKSAFAIDTIPPSTCVLVSINRFERKKDIGLAIRAFANCIRPGMNVTDAVTKCGGDLSPYTPPDVSSQNDTNPLGISLLNYPLAGVGVDSEGSPVFDESLSDSEISLETLEFPQSQDPSDKQPDKQSNKQTDKTKKKTLFPSPPFNPRVSPQYSYTANYNTPASTSSSHIVSLIKLNERMSNISNGINIIKMSQNVISGGHFWTDPHSDSHSLADNDTEVGFLSFSTDCSNPSTSSYPCNLTNGKALTPNTSFRTKHSDTMPPLPNLPNLPENTHLSDDSPDLEPQSLSPPANRSIYTSSPDRNIHDVPVLTNLLAKHPSSEDKPLLNTHLKNQKLTNAHLSIDEALLVDRSSHASTNNNSGSFAELKKFRRASYNFLSQTQQQYRQPNSSSSELEYLVNESNKKPFDKTPQSAIHSSTISTMTIDIRSPLNNTQGRNHPRTQTHMDLTQHSTNSPNLLSPSPSPLLSPTQKSTFLASMNPTNKIVYECVVDGVQRFFTKSVLIVAGGYDPRVTENVEYFEELTQLALSLGLSVSNYPNVEGDVVFLRSFSNPQRDALIRKASAIVYTPQNEHFGIVPIEAMYGGRPVIACNSGGPLETVINEKTGYSCTPKPLAFSSAFCKIFSGTGFALAVQCRNHVKEKFSVSSFTNQLNNSVCSLASVKQGADGSYVKENIETSIDIMGVEKLRKMVHLLGPSPRMRILTLLLPMLLLFVFLLSKLFLRL